MGIEEYCKPEESLCSQCHKKEYCDKYKDYKNIVKTKSDYALFFSIIIIFLFAIFGFGVFTITVSKALWSLL